MGLVMFELSCTAPDLPRQAEKILGDRCGPWFGNSQFFYNSI